jgi:membrane protease YdiL (CAAX protease family)
MSTTSSRISSEVSREPDAPVALILWLFFAVLFAALAFVGRGDVERNALYDPRLALAGGVSYGILLALTFGIAFGFNRPLPALGLRRARLRWFGAAAGVVVASLIVSAVLEPVLHAGREQGLEPTRWEPHHAAAFAANAVVIVLLAPLTEELFYRGLGARALGLFGAPVAIVGTAIMFGLAHGLLAALPALVFFGLGLAWVRVRSESVWPGVAAHATYNGLALAAAMATLSY